MPSVAEVEAHFSTCQRAVEGVGLALVNRAPGVWLVRDSSSRTVIEYWPTTGKWRDTVTGEIRRGTFRDLVRYAETRPRWDEQSLLE